MYRCLTISAFCLFVLGVFLGWGGGGVASDGLLYRFDIGSTADFEDFSMHYRKHFLSDQKLILKFVQQKITDWTMAEC